MDYYKRNKDKELKYKAERQATKKEEARRFVTEYFRNHPCVDCGEPDPYILSLTMLGALRK